MHSAERHPKRVFQSLWTGLIVLAQTALFEGTVSAQGAGRYNGWHPMMGGWGMGGLGLILTILFWVLAIALIVWLVRLLFRNTAGGEGKGESRPAALDILDERYARGDIDKSQYESMKKDILAR